jgi:hypothetical protein
MTLNWQAIKLGSGRTMFLASDQRLHSVPSEFLWQARKIDPNLIVLADSPEGWREFVRETIEMAITAADRTMLADMGIRWEE